MARGPHQGAALALEESLEYVAKFRVLLDGNEKSIWLKAAAEMGRLCSHCAFGISLNNDVTR